MELNPIFFYIFAGIAIAFSLLVVLKKNPVSSAFALVMVFFAFGAIYAMLGAHLIAILQILVYTGAIMVLFIFVIMLLNADVPSFDLGRSHIGLRAVAAGAGLVLFAALVWAFKNNGSSGIQGVFTAERVIAAGGNTRVLSELLFSEYILPFELTSVLLLGAIVGAIALAKRRGPKKVSNQSKGATNASR